MAVGTEAGEVTILLFFIQFQLPWYLWLVKHVTGKS